jgi:hypothetical protein
MELSQLLLTSKLDVGLQVRLLMPSVPGDGTEQSVGSIILLLLLDKGADDDDDVDANVVGAVFAMAFWGDPNILSLSSSLVWVCLFARPRVVAASRDVWGKISVA